MAHGAAFPAEQHIRTLDKRNNQWTFAALILYIHVRDISVMSTVPLCCVVDYKNHFSSGVELLKFKTDVL